MVNDSEDWSSILTDHPIFSLPKSLSGPSGWDKSLLELSQNTIANFNHPEDGPTPSGRRRVMVLRDADLILASGREIRVTSLGDSKLNRSTTKSYKVLHTPNIQFEIHQLSLNPSGKLLAVAGAFQVAVVVLPRPGYTRLVPTTVDCKSIQVGQFYHASNLSAPIAKIEWHPWGEAGSTLLVMTVDGKLREYDISVDTEEPQHVLSFVPGRKTGTYLAEDPSEREVASFTLGKGKADWGPLTVYAVMRSGDIYSICPYMPKNASIPSAYVHTLECFISAKQEFLSQGTSAATKNLSTLYDYQHKYISALLKQLPPGTVFPAISRPVLMHPPTTIKPQPVRQGPFLLQPSPRIIDGSEGGDATDIIYLNFGDGYDENESETERLGVFMIVYQDGKVDVCLDVEKVEARWENKQDSRLDLPMFAVYETIDLGLVSTLTRTSVSQFGPPALDLLQGNHPLFVADPIHDDTVYVYHAFGVHALHLGSVLQALALALRADDDGGRALLTTVLEKPNGTIVQPILTTFSVERKSSNPIVAVSIPNDIYLTYSIFILTSAMRIISIPLNLRSESPNPRVKQITTCDDQEQWPTPIEGPPAYVSLLTAEPYVIPPVLSRTFGLPTNPRLALPQSNSTEFMLTPDMLRLLGVFVERFSTQIHDIVLAFKAAEARSELHGIEFSRQRDYWYAMTETMEKLKGPWLEASQEKLKRIQEGQKALLTRLDRILQSLMQKASPELSEHETKWFEELRRMKDEVGGAGRYEEWSLAARTSLLQREYGRLLPNLRAMLEKETEHKKQTSEYNKGLGFSQAFELGECSVIERARISDLEKEVLSLASRLELSLGRPPPLRPPGHES